MDLVRIEGLPGDPLAAAERFHSVSVPELTRKTGDLLLIFPAHSHPDLGWRAAAVQALARAAAPRRINAVAGGDAAGVASAVGYLEAAPGVTGHYLVLDGAGAGPVLASSA